MSTLKTREIIYSECYWSLPDGGRLEITLTERDLLNNENLQRFVIQSGKFYKAKRKQQIEAVMIEALTDRKHELLLLKLQQYLDNLEDSYKHGKMQYEINKIARLNNITKRVKHLRNYAKKHEIF